MTRLAAIEGIGDVYAEKLRAAGIAAVEALLERGATPRDRQALAEQTGVSLALLLEWINRADLFRVRGIGEEYSDLLESAGVDTVRELAQRNPENLYLKLAETNQAKHLVRRLPGASHVGVWVAQAKRLPRAIEY